MYSTIVRPLLFRLSPETAHEVTLDGLNALYRLRLDSLLAARQPVQPVTVFGLRFANRLGLAAGLDKNADYLDALGALGFGHVEVGTVTPRAQPGNPAPRLFRLADHQAVINRMGFNNKGVDHLVENLRHRRYTGVVGVNIGKNRDTPTERAADDYLYCLQRVYSVADYVTVNLSSPNTPGLRDLQAADRLGDLLGRLTDERARLQSRQGRRVPVLVKIAPDLMPAAVEELASVLVDSGVDGVIATNTTLDRAAVADSPHADESGGLSGAPLAARAAEIQRLLCLALDGALPVIGVGGIMSPADAVDRVQAGAQLIQVYTGLMYEGPALVRGILRALGNIERR